MSERPVMNKLRTELYRELPLRADQLESERRKLVTSLSDPPIKRKRTSRASLMLVAAAALLLATVGAAYWFIDAESSKSATALQTIAGLRWLKNAPLPEGVELHTTPTKGAKFVTADGDAIWVDRESAVAARRDGGSGVVLRRGNLLVDVRKRAENDPFVVQTPAGEVIVHGTVFSVRLREDRVLVRLYRGAVSLKNATGQIALKPGYGREFGTPGTESNVALDRAAIIADLLIAETTAELAGPKIPVIDLPTLPAAKENSPSVEAPNPAPIAPPKSQNGVRKKPAEAPSSTVAEPPPAMVAPAPATLSDPELAGIHVEVKDAPEAAPPPEEDLMDKALGEIREGNHENGRTLLKEYLFKFPEGRYVEPVEEILSR